MPNYRISYLKTALPAAFAGVCVILVAIVVAPSHGMLRGVVLTLGAMAALPLELIATSGLIVLLRDVVITQRKRDLFQAWNDSRSDAAFAAEAHDFGLRLRQFARAMVAPNLLVVGDEVEVRSLEEIRRTLDETDCLDALPFMPEMMKFCGRRARVFRRVDKIYDYGGKKVVRRLEQTVLLHQMRCDGAGHGGCQAGCSLMWKEAWLKRVSRKKAAVTPAEAQNVVVSTGLKPQFTLGLDGTATYRCQFTQLVAASTPLRDWDPRQDLRPLVAGNITVAGFTVAILTRLFDYVQGKRGGMRFLPMEHVHRASAAVTTPGLDEGQTVHVRAPEQIFLTLDKNFKNRGLWFDRDMLKHCGHAYEVLKRVDRIIDDASGRMLIMKTPCFVLKGVNYSGEFLRFLAQEEHLYWREAWLSSTSADGELTDRPDRLVAGNA